MYIDNPVDKLKISDPAWCSQQVEHWKSRQHQTSPKTNNMTKLNSFLLSSLAQQQGQTTQGGTTSTDLFQSAIHTSSPANRRAYLLSVIDYVLDITSNDDFGGTAAATGGNSQCPQWTWLIPRQTRRRSNVFHERTSTGAFGRRSLSATAYIPITYRIHAWIK
jgi:hypothetical protein